MSVANTKLFSVHVFLKSTTRYIMVKLSVVLSTKKLVFLPKRSEKTKNIEKYLLIKEHCFNKVCFSVFEKNNEKLFALHVHTE